MIKLGHGTGGITSCSATANGLLCSGMASVWKWKSDSGLLELAKSEKAPWGSRVTKNTYEFEDGIEFDCERVGGRWWVAVRSCPFSASHMPPCSHCQALLCPWGTHSPFHAEFSSANKSESLLQLVWHLNTAPQPLGCPKEPHLEACSTNCVQTSSTGQSASVLMPVPCIFQFLQIHLFVH